MMKRLLVLLAFLPLVLSSCSKLGEMEVRELELKSFQLLSTTSANIEVEYVIHNPTSKKLILDNVNGFLKKGDVNFAQVTLIEADTVAAKRVSVNRLVFKLDIQDPLSLLSMGLNISKWHYSDFTVDARAVVKTSDGGRRVIKIKNMSMENLINRL